MHANVHFTHLCSPKINCSKKSVTVLTDFNPCLTYRSFSFQLYISWADDVTVSEVTYPRYGSVYPWPLNTILSWQKKRAVTKKLSALGWMAKSLDEVYAEVERCCQALSESKLKHIASPKLLFVALIDSLLE